jgi:LmbE family N-acetylglucosaminyl deacetylase
MLSPAKRGFFVPNFMERAFNTTLDREKLSAKRRAIVVEAHPDDAALAEGLDVKLSRKGVGVIIATFTDGAARFDGIDGEKLAAQRRGESINSAKKSEAAMVINFGYPDGKLSDNEAAVIESFADLVDSIDPELIILPHELDPHEDHAGAHRIAKKVAQGGLPLYSMDTISMKDRYGSPIVPTHYFSLSSEEYSIRNEAYLAHKSQVTNLPSHESRAVRDVLELPQRRGDEIHIPYAGIVVKDLRSERDPIKSLFRGEIFTSRT